MEIESAAETVKNERMRLFDIRPTIDGTAKSWTLRELLNEHYKCFISKDEVIEEYINQILGA